MNVYCVVLNEAAKDEEWNAFKKKWPNSLVLTPHLAFVNLGALELTSEIRKALNMNDDGRRTGTIIRITPGQYTGYNKKELWEWLKRELKETDN